MRLILAFVLALSASLASAQTKDKPTVAPPDQPDKKESFERFAGKTLHDWMKELKNTDPSLKRDAIQAVQVFRETNKDLVNDLVHILESDVDTGIRIHAAIALSNVGIDDAQIGNVVRALAKQLEINFQVNVRYHCALTLSRFGEDAAPAIPALAKQTGDRGAWEIRQVCCAALARAGVDEKTKAVDVRATTGLINASSDLAAKVRLEAIMGLAIMGPPQNPTVQTQLIRALQARLMDRDKGVVVWAYFGLIANRGMDEKYVNGITNLLKNGDVSTKLHALQALGRLGKEVKPRLKDIIDAVSDADPFVAAAACLTLAGIKDAVDPGAPAEAAIKTILDLAKEEDMIKDPKVKKKINPSLRNAAQFSYDVLTGKIKPVAKKPE